MVFVSMLSNHHERPTLPPIHELIQGPLLQCRLLCGRDFSDINERQRHETICDGHSVQTADQLQRPVNTQDSQFSLWPFVGSESSSSSSTPGTNSDSGSSTLGSSRRPSAEEFVVAAKPGRHGRPGNTDDLKQKNVKEKRQRALISDEYQLNEDATEIYCDPGSRNGIAGHGQSAGNAKTSGLNKRKIDDLRNQNTLYLYLLDEKMKEAISKGTDDELAAFLRRKLESRRDDPTMGTLMQGAYEGDCDEHGDVQLCPHSTACRKRMARTTYENNVKRFKYDHQDIIAHNVKLDEHEEKSNLD